MKQLSDRMKFWMQSTNYIFKQFDDDVLGSKVKAGKLSSNTRRIFIDNGGDVLFVAHVDTVLSPKIGKHTSKRLYATGLDDRLGCMLAYELGTELSADILLTDDEEKCRSTAGSHICKDYNWVVEFDRAGKDVVTYGLDNLEFITALSDYWKVGIGSYSDIADLAVRSCCFNLGIGYEHAHGIDSYVSLKILRSQIAKFKDFYSEYHGKQFIADIKPETVSTYSSYMYAENCDICGREDNLEEAHGFVICKTCFDEMIDKILFVEN